MSTESELRRLLGENAALSARAAAHGAKIREAAVAELDRINARLRALTPAACLADEAKAHEYRRLIEDRGRLNHLLGGSQ